ncbi:hypothetical protein K474DRAFT_1660748 [Panus rudis PR-1116 ss-1]|nr:hypothetical protein K474DRAFT_1660748 [Panus rudis PR-1116 ss-1]
MTKTVRDSSWSFATPRDASLSPQEIDTACQMLADFLPTIVEFKAVDRFTGPAILVEPFSETWVRKMATRDILLHIMDYFKGARRTYATRETLPLPSPALSSYIISQATSEADVPTFARLFVEFTEDDPIVCTYDGAVSVMRDAVRNKQVWYCRVDGTIVGYILIGCKTPRTVAIRNVYTARAYRRRGIAEALVRAVTRYYLGAEPLGFEGAPEGGPEGGIKEEIVLSVDDPVAWRVYKRCGFMLDDDARDPKNGKIGWFAFMWRGVEPVSEK